MKDNQGLIVAAVVGIVAIVGLVMLLQGNGASGKLIGTQCEQVVDAQTGVGSFICRSNHVGPQFVPEYLDQERRFGIYDQFSWDGQ